MDTKQYGRIVSKNLRRIAVEREKTQSDIVNDLKISKATVSSWMNGTRVPRMDKIDLLCRYFHCTRSDIMEERPEKERAPLDTEELILIDAYRAADPISRRNIRTILGIPDSMRKADLTG